MPIGAYFVVHIGVGARATEECVASQREHAKCSLSSSHKIQVVITALVKQEKGISVAAGAPKAQKLLRRKQGRSEV
jgi:hypothetical protein